MLNNNFTFYFTQRNYLRKDGKASVLLVFILNRTPYKLATGVFCKPENWNDKDQRVEQDPQYLAYNSKLAKFLHQANRAANDLDFEEKLSIDALRKVLIPDKKPKSFTKWADDNLERIIADLAWGTQRYYRSFCRKLKLFRGNIDFHEINETLIAQFDAFLKLNLKNSVNTAASNHKCFRKLLNAAFGDGLILQNPYFLFKVKKEKTRPEHLSEKEVGLLWNYYKTAMPGTQIHTSLRSFLFSCFTGLAYQEVKNSKWKHLNNNILTIIRQKTDHPLMIPINDFARQFLVLDQDPEKSILGNVYPNQKINEYLKVCAAHVGINKRISMHVGRHTFAILGLKSGINLSTLQALLGHSDIRVTQIYLNHYNHEIFENAQRFNNLDFGQKT